MNISNNIQKNNFKSMMIEGGFFFTGYTFFDVYVIIPVFIYTFTGNIRLVGLAVAIKLFFFMLPQLFMGLYTSHITNIPKFLGILGFGGRFMYLLLPLILIIKSDSTIKMIVLFIALLVGSVADGITNVPWLDLVGRTITPAKRPKLLGYQMLLGGSGGLLAGIFIKQVLSTNWADNSKYALIFLVGAFLLIISGLLLFTLKDQRKIKNTKRESLGFYFSKLPGYIKKSIEYRKLITTQALAGFNSLAAPVYILYAKSYFGLDDASVSTLMLAQISGSLAGGYIWGHMGHKKGNKSTIQYGIMMNIITVSTAVLLYFSSGRFIFAGLLIMIFFAGLSHGNYIGYTNYLFEIIRPDDQPAYIALTGTLLFPLTLVPFLGGIIADSFGYMILFFIVTFFIIISFFTSFRLKSSAHHIL